LSKQVKLYFIFFALSLTGIAWLLFEQMTPHAAGTSLCLFKLATGIPCPSCGTTSSLILVLRGEFANAFLVNPLGYVAGLALVVFPLWLLRDLLMKEISFFKAYTSAEQLLRKKVIFIPGILIILFNWYWSIVKMI